MPTPVALSQLVDLALGTPEVGAVNFNILHTLLHAMIQKLNIQDVKADVDEHDRELLSVHAIPRTVSAFSVDSGYGPSGYSKTEDSFSEDNLSEKSSYAAPKKSSYHQLEKQVALLTKQMEELNKLPSNDILMGKMNNKESERPVSDMWQYMQLKKRVDANEEGVGKLMSLVEDLMKEMKDLKENQKALMDKVNGINFDDIYSRLNQLDSQLNLKTGLDQSVGKIQMQPSENLNAELDQSVTKIEMQPSENLNAELDQSVTKIEMQPSENLKTDLDRSVPKIQIQPAENLKAELDHSVAKIEMQPSEKNLEQAMEDKFKILDDKYNSLDDKYNSLSDKLSSVPNLDDLEQYFSQFVTWPGLEDALKGIKLDFENLQPISEERVVIELGTQTDTPEPKSRPTSARPVSRASSARSQRSSSGPSAELLEILEKLGQLAASHENLRQRVEELERLMELKANKSDLEGVGISDDLITSLRNLQDELKALQEGQLRDTSTEMATPSPSPINHFSHHSLSPRRDNTNMNKPIENDALNTSTTPDKRQYPNDEYNLSALNMDTNSSFNTDATHGNRNTPLSLSLSQSQHECALPSPSLSISPEDLVSEPIFDSPLTVTSPPVLPPITRKPSPTSGINSVKEQDEAAIKRLQEALQKVQQDIDKLHNTIEAVVEENVQRVKQIQELTNYCDNLEKKKADKEYVDMEVDVKADRRLLEGKVNHSLFDSTTNELNKLIKDILDRLNGQEGDWKSALAKAMEELDGKLDRLELSNLKDWLEKQLKMLNNKIKSMGSGGWNLDDEAAGMKKQLIQRFHCLSCDKPVDVMPHNPIPSIPGNFLPKSKSPRPYTTFELDQIRQHARSLGMNPEMTDYYATLRQCGGSHTTTYPNKRTTKLNHLGQLFREEETILPLHKEEVDVQGADGHIYKGRMDSARLEAKLPTNLTTQHSHPIYMQQEKAPSPKPPNKPISARVPRPSSARLGSPSPQNHVPTRTVPRNAEYSMAAPHNSQIGGSRATTPHQEEGEVNMVADGNEAAGEVEDQRAVDQEEVNIDVPIQVQNAPEDD